MKPKTPEEIEDEDESFFQRFALSVEDMIQQRLAPHHCYGGYRWFRSANVVDLQQYRSPAEKERIRAVLLYRRW